MRQDLAETLALEALAWLAADADMLRNFCNASGIDPSDLRLAAEDPEILAGVLDFVIMDDEWVTDFAASAGLEPEAVVRARAALPGGAAPHWT